MSDIPTNHLITFEHIADQLSEDIVFLNDNEVMTLFDYKKCCEYVFLAFDDLAVSRLKRPNLPLGGRRIAFVNSLIINSGIQENELGRNLILTLQGILANIDLLVSKELESIVPFQTWGYIFIQRLGTSLRVEITGDRRIDEWALLTNNGKLSMDEVLDNFTQALKDRANDIVDGGLPIDLHELARLLLVDKPH